MPAHWPWRSPDAVRRVGLAALLAVTAAAGASAQSWQQRPPSVEEDLPAAVDVAAADRMAIQDVVDTQLAAIWRDDRATAFALASPLLQVRYGTAERFLAMVRQDYAAIYRARHVRYRDLVMFRGYVTQRLSVAGTDGLESGALYLMTLLSDGRWVVSGCILETGAAPSS